MDLARARQFTRKRQQPRKNSSDFYPLGGGLNLIDSPLVATPGECQNALNYEIGFAGGYKRIGGYEARDGRPSLADASYWKLPFAAKEKPTWENISGGSVNNMPYDSHAELIRGQTTGSMGVMVDAQQDGGYGENVLLYNNTFDSAGWNLSAGTVAAVFDESEFRGYQWTTPDATVDFLPLWTAASAASGTNKIQALSDPISCQIGDMLYVSVLARYYKEATSAADGIRMTIENATGNPFGGSGTPTIDFDVKRGVVISGTATDQFQNYGVTILGDGVLRLWARTKICSVADTTMTLGLQLLREDPAGTWNATFTQTVYTMHCGVAMAVVWENLTSPHNHVNGRELADTTNSWTASNLTPTDGVTAWASGVYADFSRLVETTANSIHQLRSKEVVSGSSRLNIRFCRGDKIKVEFYAKYTAAQREGIGVILEFNEYNKYGFAAVPKSGFDLENGQVATDITGIGTLDQGIESITITDLGSGIYHCQLVTDPFIVHGVALLALYMLEGTGTPGELNYIYTGDGSSYVELTGVRVQAVPSPDRDYLAEVVTTSASKNVNTGNLIIVGETIGRNFQSGETLETVTPLLMSSVDKDPVVEQTRTFGEARGRAILNGEADGTLDATYVTLAELVAYKPDELIPTGYSRLAWSSASNDSSNPTYVYSTPQRPPGSGPVRGLVFYQGFIYAFRDTEDQSSLAIWKSSGRGWRRVDRFVYALGFDTGTGTEPQPGDVVIESSAGGPEAYVLHVDTTSGTWGTDAAGTIYVKLKELDNTSGWSNTADLNEDDGATKVCGLTGDTDYLDYLTLNSGGKYEFRAGNLYGDKNRNRLYWVSGEDTAYEFDGVVEGFAPISTGMTVDKPTHLAIHNYHLFLAYPSGSIQLSGDGDPHAWTVITGATEIAVGDEPTGFIEEVSNSLLIFTRNQTWVLNGNTRANFDLDDFNINAGGHEWSLQRIGLATYFDDRGFTSLRQTSRGDSVDYQENTQSEKIQPLIEDLLQKAEVTTSHLIKDENIYRCYFDDGRVVSIGFDGHQVAGHMPLRYPFVAESAYSGEDGNGAERIFVGTTDGDVFELEAGTSFNGDAMSYFLRSVLYTSKSPGMMKKYRHARLDGTFDGDLALAGRIEFDFDDPELNLGAELDFSNDSAGGYWDDMDFDSFIWDKTKSGNPQVKVEGEGTNCSIYLHGESATDKIHTLRGMTLQWTARRDDRRST